MTSIVRSESRVRVSCSECGASIVLTERQARRRDQRHRCPVCLVLAYHRAEPVEDRHRRYWLEHFSDEEIAILASDILGEEVPVARVQARWNRALLGV